MVKRNDGNNKNPFRSRYKHLARDRRVDLLKTRNAQLRAIRKLEEGLRKERSEA